MIAMGSASYPRPTWRDLLPQPVDPWPDAPLILPRLRLPTGCVYCGLPRSDYDGHWCLFGGRETWRRWPS